MPKQIHRIVAGLLGLLVSATPVCAMAWPWPGRQRDLTGSWLDAFNFLDLIPGQPFVLLYIPYAALVIVTLKLLLRFFLPQVEGASLPDLDEKLRFELKPNYLELAYLKGGRKAVIEATLCNLYRQGVVSANLGRSKIHRDQRVLTRLTTLEQALTDAFDHGLPPYQLTRHSSVRSALAHFETKAKAKLRQLGLLAARPTYLTACFAMILALTLVDGLGLIRLARSLMRGYSNVGILVIQLVVFAGVILLVFKPRLTRGGINYLRQLKQEYQPLSRKVQARTQAWDAPEVLYAVAVCGASSLLGTGYSTIHTALQPPASASSGGGSCASCGGGGCGGGGCGGGGCGGG